jgi:hypothetical protein
LRAEGKNSGKCDVIIHRQVASFETNPINTDFSALVSRDEGPESVVESV